MDIKPGDLIEWVYKFNRQPVVETEELWSTIEKRWVSVGEKVLLISIVDDTITYFCSKGLFRVHVNDTMAPRALISGDRVVPRTCG